MNLQATLSKREEELVPYLISHRTKKEIATEIYRSVRTVENHARNIFEKLEISKSTELCVWYFVKHFSIPVEQLPKSLLAIAFLMLFGFYEYKSSSEVMRTARTSSVRAGRRKSDDYPIIEC